MSDSNDDAEFERLEEHAQRLFERLEMRDASAHAAGLLALLLLDVKEIESLASADTTDRTGQHARLLWSQLVRVRRSAHELLRSLDSVLAPTKDVLESKVLHLTPCEHALILSATLCASDWCFENVTNPPTTELRQSTEYARCRLELARHDTAVDVSDPAGASDEMQPVLTSDDLDSCRTALRLVTAEFAKSWGEFVVVYGGTRLHQCDCGIGDVDALARKLGDIGSLESVLVRIRAVDAAV